MLRHRLCSARLAISAGPGRLHAGSLSRFRPRHAPTALVSFSELTRWNSSSTEGKKGIFSKKGSSLAAALRKSSDSRPPRPSTTDQLDPTRPGTDFSPDHFEGSLKPPEADTNVDKATRKAIKAATKSAKAVEKPKAGAKAAERIHPTTKRRPRRKRATKADLGVESILPDQLSLEAVEQENPENAKLSYGLDRVLFNPGVYHLSDPRTGVYNFDPYLASIMPVDQFDWNALKGFVSSSADTKLRRTTIAHGKKYCGSTSSMTAMLSHFHFLLSSWRPLSFENLSQSITPLSTNFVKYQRGPASSYAIFRDGVYSFDSDKEYDRETVLSMMGKSMEKLLTLPKEEFEKYRRTRSHLLSEEEKNADEVYHYTTLGDFMMRSQQDAYDPRLPGTGTFDLKTRAVVSIRMDMDHAKSTGYEIRKRFGQWNSFEREYHDMVRSAFLKYSLQVRMGRMDGIFVAFHNTQRIFGFQYVSLEEMDAAIHGSNSRWVGDQEFKASLALLNDLMDRAAKRFPGQSLRLLVETRPTTIPLTYFFVEPVTEEEIKQSNEETRRKAEEMGDSIQGQLREAASASQTMAEGKHRTGEAPRGADESTEGDEKDEAGSEEAWGQMVNKIEEIIELESLGLQSVRQAFQDVLDPSSDEELDALMRDIENLTAASPGMKELNEASASDPDRTGENELASDTASDELVKEDVEEADAEVDRVHRPWLHESSVPGYDDPVQRPDYSDLAHELDDVAKEPSSSQAEEAETPARLDPAEIGTEQENGVKDEGSDITTTSSSPRQEKEDALRKLIAQVTEGMGDREGSRLRALIARVAARAKIASTTTAEPVETEVVPETEGTPEAKAEDDVTSAATEEATSEAAAKESTTKRPSKEILGMYVTVQNHVNNKVVPRVTAGPDDMGGSPPKWKVEYTVTELPDSEAWRIREQMLGRRKGIHDEAGRNKDEIRDTDYFLKTVSRMSEEGARYRMQLEQVLADKPVQVVWGKDTLPPEVRNSGLTGNIFDEAGGETNEGEATKGETKS
jgi:hypothetical protein